MSPRSVVVSTVAPSPAAVRAAAALPCKLAWSVHAAEDELRLLLVPTTRHKVRVRVRVRVRVSRSP